MFIHRLSEGQYLRLMARIMFINILCLMTCRYWYTKGIFFLFHYKDLFIEHHHNYVDHIKEPSKRKLTWTIYLYVNRFDCSEIDTYKRINHKHPKVITKWKKMVNYKQFKSSTLTWYNLHTKKHNKNPLNTSR